MPPQPDPIPDWSFHYTGHCSELERLDHLRTYHPIIWALIIGHRTSRSIAHHLGMPHAPIIYELRRYKKQGLTHDEQRPTTVSWHLDDPEALLLQDYIRSVRRADKLALDADTGES